ncbi:MAG: HIRAN domain-containing protein [Desulfobacterales bacterium]|nr:HIRAN domain-containing protein [Desulfobacterales bacterium]
MNPITTRLAGVTHGDAQANIKKYGGPGIGHYDLIREPANPHDSNAIRVALFGKIFMGYIPAPLAATLAPLMDQGRKLVAEFVRKNSAPGQETIGMTVQIVELKSQNTPQAG